MARLTVTKLFSEPQRCEGRSGAAFLTGSFILSTVSSAPISGISKYFRHMQDINLNLKTSLYVARFEIGTTNLNGMIQVASTGGNGGTSILAAAASGTFTAFGVI